jgi:NAD(P)-dependent dehydrogenase (short-subunit alcohol dehydrogenase family)
VSGDLTNAETINQIMSAAGEKIDVLINNAGIMDEFVPLDELDDELWNRVIAVNLTSVMKLSREVIKRMLLQEEQRPTSWICHNQSVAKKRWSF